MRHPACVMLAVALLLGGCQGTMRPNPARDAIRDEIQRAVEQRERVAVPPAVSQALLAPPAAPTAPRERPPAAPAEPRFNLAVNNAPAAQVFAAIASGTRYSMVVHPEVSGGLTVNLKEVTLPEALETIREVYGYDYRITGNRVVVQPLTLTSRIYHVNYLAGSRTGRSDTRVTSGSILTGGGGALAGGGAAPAGNGGVTSDGTVVSTQSKSDFWAELTEAIKAVVGPGEGRSVVASPQSGAIIVRAMPRELREVEQFLKMSRLSLERQVMLEAKIVEVVLNDGYQHGINWMALTKNRTHRLSTGVDTRQIQVPSGGQGQSGVINQIYDEASGTYVPNTLGNLVATPIVGAITGLISGSPLSGALGMAFTTNSFNAILSFLETQGNIHVLSSPRIATLNNQKAVLKVGSDDFFVTNISTTTTSSAAGSVTSPTINLQPFFSGISLDVTPQIDDGENVMLHIRPSVSVVTERNKQINLGTAGVFNLPLASSRTNETDSMVRVREGNVVAIGGLMEQAQSTDSAKVPGVGEIPVAGELFSQGRRAGLKRELVVLLKATVIRGDRQWEQDLGQTAERLARMQPAPAAWTGD